MRTLQILFLLFLTICLSGCYQVYLCELKTDHLLVSATDHCSFAQDSLSEIESDFNNICETHEFDFCYKGPLVGYNHILWTKGSRFNGMSVSAYSKKNTRITFGCRKIDAEVSKLQSIIQDFKSYLRKNNIEYKEKHYTRWNSEIDLLN